MPNHRLQFFHRRLPRVGEVDFVVEAGGGEVVYVVVGLEKIIHDDAFRKEIIAIGRENSKRFSPATIAEQYAQLYRL